MTQPAPHQDVAFHDGRASELLAVLMTELHGTTPGTWAQRRIRQGFNVAVTITEDGTRRARVTQVDRPGNATAWDRFHQEVETLVQHLRIAHWATVAPNEPIRGAVIEFKEPRVTEA